MTKWFKMICTHMSKALHNHDGPTDTYLLEQKNDDKTLNIWTTVLTKLQYVLDYQEIYPENIHEITYLLNDVFYYIYQHKDYLQMTEEGAFTIEEQLINFVHVKYYQYYALKHLEYLFDIHVQSEDGDEYIINKKGKKTFLIV